mmetsp:Transcript_98712/g.274665  ORF Transcript_98712/g.274665 Transcript_98712/m.274665 type:complete len:384 (-) Transcript_98712:577-1728(-)
MLSEFLSYFLNKALISCSSSFAEARVSKETFIFNAFSTVAKASRLQLPILWRSCANNCLVSTLSFPSAPSCNGFVFGASFIAGWCSRKNSEQFVAILSASAPASLMPDDIASTSWRLKSTSALKLSAFSFKLSRLFSAVSTSSRNCSKSCPARSSASRFFLSSSCFFSSSFRRISLTASTRFCTCATTVSHSSCTCCCFSPSFATSLSKTSSNSLFASSKLSNFATRTFCCAFRISDIAFNSTALLSCASFFCLSSSSLCLFISSSRFFCSSTFRLISASCSSFRLRLASSTFFLFSSILFLMSSCRLASSMRRCCSCCCCCWRCCCCCCCCQPPWCCCEPQLPCCWCCEPPPPPQPPCPPPPEACCPDLLGDHCWRCTPPPP